MGIKSSKRSKEALSEAELKALVTSTKMSRAEIIKWHRGFMNDCPSGRLTKNEFIKIYEELFPSGRAKKFCDLVFNVFDKNKSNSIEFSEFIMACSLTSRGKPRDRLKLSFEVYDADSNGILDREEMQKIIEAVYELYEGAPISKNDSMRKVDVIMSKFDSNKNGSVSKTEFIEGVSNDPQIAAFLAKRQDSGQALFKMDAPAELTR